MQNHGLLKYKVHHVLFWMLVFGTWYFLRYQDYSSGEIAFQVTLLKVTDLALMIYLTNGVLIPQLLYKKRYVAFGAIFLLMILASGFIKVYIMDRILGHPELFSLSGDLKIRIYENVISDFFLVTAGSAFKLMFDYTKLQQRMAETAKEKAEAELNFLKSQINPHFLFNSLNSVYFLIDKNNIEARQSLHKFSDMLRYQLYELNGDKISIEREVAYLKDYVDLQKLRKDENYTVEFDSATSVKGFSIGPLLLVPFVENAFKHISHFSNKNNFVKLSLDRENGHFNFVVENSREAGKSTEQHGGIGLVNVKRRLELLYPGKYSLDIKEEEDKYKVKLSLKVDE
ncbi:MAG: histidine kinase [Chitinophagaceae bacterium]